MPFSPADDQLAEEFEQLLRSGGQTNELQDKLMQSLKWTERQHLTPIFLKQIEASARHTLRNFLEDQPRYTAMAGMTPDPRCADDLTVTHDGQGHITINLPAEVRRWLLQTQSMISS